MKGGGRGEEGGERGTGRGRGGGGGEKVQGGGYTLLGSPSLSPFALSTSPVPGLSL